MNGLRTRIPVHALFLLLPLILPAQQYTPFSLTDGDTWSHTECGYKPEWGAIYKLQIAGDTLINSTFYKKVFIQIRKGYGVCSNCGFNFNLDSAFLFALLREDVPKKRIYFIYPYIAEKEWLGYDFDISGVGESIVGFSLIFSTEGEYTTAGIYVYQLIVDSIDSICVDGIYSKRYYFGGGNNGNPYHLPEYWIEGIGSTHGLLVQGFGAPGWEQNMYCYNNKDGGVYYDTAAFRPCVAGSAPYCNAGSDCTPPTGISNPVTGHDINIYPNPAKDWLIIEYKEFTGRIQIQLMNSFGIALLKKDVKTPYELISIPLNGFPRGIYFLSVQTGKSVMIHKIIKD